jgi:hypothetical protein
MTNPVVATWYEEFEKFGEDEVRRFVNVGGFAGAYLAITQTCLQMKKQEREERRRPSSSSSTVPPRTWQSGRPLRHLHRPAWQMRWET